MSSTLTIGKLAKKADVSIDSIRFYEREGLLAVPSRTESNYRLYSQDAVARLRFIKRAKALGFTLTEIRDFIELSHNPSASKADVKRKTREKIEIIQARIEDLGRMLTALDLLDKSCDGHGPIAGCPILNALAGDEGEKSTINDERSEL